MDMQTNGSAIGEEPLDGGFQVAASDQLEAHPHGVGVEGAHRQRPRCNCSGTLPTPL
jgi:hypothetical protein